MNTFGQFATELKRYLQNKKTGPDGKGEKDCENAVNT